jgi:hypothetical protein
MKGRSPFNKPSSRKKDLYELLFKLGGEARWKDLDANLKQLGWGPTTLKQTLDQMVKDRSIIKEARLGAKGAEVWYRTLIAWLPTPKDRELTDLFGEMITSTRDAAKKLQGKQREEYLLDTLRMYVIGVMRTHISHLLLILRQAQIHKLNYSEALQSFDLSLDAAIKLEDKVLLGLLLEYGEYSMEAIDQILREPYKPASVKPRSMTEFTSSSDSSVIKWVETWYRGWLQDSEK